MNNSAEARRAAFKKTVDSDEGRRRRTDTSIRLRKDKKEESLAKRRAASSLNSKTNGVSSSMDVNNVDNNDQNNSNSSGNRRIYTATDIPELLVGLQQPSVNPEACLESVRGFRRMLSVEKNPPVDAVLHCGLLPILVEIIGSPTVNPALHFEAAWALTNIASTDYTAKVVEAGAVPHLTMLLMSPHPDTREQAAWCLGNIAGDCTDLRDIVLQSGALEPMIKNITEPANSSLLANVVWSLSNMCRGKPQPDFALIGQCVPILAHLLKNASPTNKEVLIDVCWALSYLSDGEEFRIQAVVDTGVTPILVNLLDCALDSNDNNIPGSIANPIIRTLGNIVSGNDSQTQAVIDTGIISRSRQLLNHPKKNVKKETCWLLSNIAAGTQSQITSLVSQQYLMGKIVSLTERAEWDIRKEATWVLSNIATGGSDDHVECLVEYNAIRSLCSMLNIPDGKMITVALDALDRILEVGEKLGKGYVTLVDEADGIDLLERLQEHDNENVYRKTVEIIEKYFNVEDEDENLAPADDGNAFTFGVDASKQHFNFAAETSPMKNTVGFGQQQQPTHTHFSF